MDATINGESAKAETSKVTTTAEQSKGKRRPGRQAVQRKQDKFRAEKNAQFQAELQATLLRRLHVTDPTNVSAIKLQSSVVPTRVPISLRGVPTLVSEVWARMKAIGTRPFMTLATEENYRVFLRIVLLLCECKVAYAQMKCVNKPRVDLPTQYRFTEMELRVLSTLSTRLPFPLVILIEAIGNFSAGPQPVVPVFIQTNPLAASGAVNLCISDVAMMVREFRTPVRADSVVAAIAHAIDDLPGLTWITEQREVPAILPPGPTPAQQPMVLMEHVRLDQSAIDFWGRLDVSAHERTVFLQIIASMESKKGFLLQMDITTGDGSIVQVVRFPDEFVSSETETLYYMNADVPTFEEQLSPALLLGYEYAGTAFSRFTGNYDECLKHGSSSQSEARHALVWSDKVT